MASTVTVSSADMFGYCARRIRMRSVLYFLMYSSTVVSGVRQRRSASCLRSR